MELTIISMRNSISPDKRRTLLKEKIKKNGFVRIIEVHNGLSALIAEKAQVKQKNELIEYDGFWESSLTDTASKGIPDAEGYLKYVYDKDWRTAKKTTYITGMINR